MAFNHVQSFSTTLILKKRQVKTSRKYCISPIRLSKIENLMTHCAVIHWRLECKLVNFYGGQSKYGTRILFDPAIPSPRICHAENLKFLYSKVKKEKQ